MKLTLLKTITYSIYILIFFSCSTNKNDQTKIEISMPKMGICAHRGAMNTHPENTIPAFIEAIRLGSHMIEFDVRLTKDKKLVILHDPTVDRTTNGNGEIYNLTLKEVKELDAGSWKDQQFKDIKIPTLKEVLSIMPNNIWLNIHLKGGDELGRKTALTIVESNREHQSVIACGNKAALSAKNISPTIKICNMERFDNRTKYISETIKNKNEFIQLLKRRGSLDIKNDLELLKENNIMINYFGSDSELEIKELFQIGVDFILANDLAPTLKIAEKLGVKRLMNEE